MARQSKTSHHPGPIRTKKDSGSARQGVVEDNKRASTRITLNYDDLTGGDGGRSKYLNKSSFFFFPPVIAPL
jgi:hypothetical protein